MLFDERCTYRENRSCAVPKACLPCLRFLLTDIVGSDEVKSWCGFVWVVEFLGRRAIFRHFCWCVFEPCMMAIPSDQASEERIALHTVPHIWGDSEPKHKVLC